MFSWENKIEEKELGPWGIFHDYPKMVDEWVFGHVKSLLEESENRPELAKTEASLLEEQKTLRKKRPLKQSDCKKW